MRYIKIKKCKKKKSHIQLLICGISPASKKNNNKLPSLFYSRCFVVVGFFFLFLFTPKHHPHIYLIIYRMFKLFKGYLFLLNFIHNVNEYRQSCLFLLDKVKKNNFPVYLVFLKQTKNLNYKYSGHLILKIFI